MVMQFSNFDEYLRLLTSYGLVTTQLHQSMTANNFFKKALSYIKNPKGLTRCHNDSFAQQHPGCCYLCRDLFTSVFGPVNPTSPSHKPWSLISKGTCSCLGLLYTNILVPFTS